MNEQQLAAIAERCAVWQRSRQGAVSMLDTIRVMDQVVGEDIPALVARVRALTAEVERLKDDRAFHLLFG